MRRLPLPVVALGAVVLLLVLVGGVVAYRVNTGDPHGAPAATQPPADQAPAGQAEDVDPESKLTPRTGEPEPLREGKLNSGNDYLGLYGRGRLTVQKYEWSGNGDIAPAAGKKYLNLQVQLTSTQDVVLAKPIQFTIRSAGGNEDLLPTIGSGKDDQLAYEMLRPPDSATFWISFEAPQQPSVLYFADEGINTLLAIPVPAN